MVPDATMGWNSPQLPQKWRGAAWLTALLLCLSAIQLPRCDAEGEFAANSAETCAAEEPEGTLIFQPASVSCVPCGANESAAADGLACECADGHRIVRTTPSLACERCPDDQVVSLDGFGCERCDANLTIFEDGATCLSCRGNAVIASTGVGTPVPIRTCITCADGWMRDPGTVIPVQCVRCPDPLMQPVGDNPCACPASYVAAAGHCVRRAGERLVGLVDFPDTGLEIESVVVEELLLKAAALCSDSVRNATQCQVLANLCALQLFASTAEACIQHRALAATSVGIDPVHGWDAWPQGLPWLEYDSIADLSRYRDDLDLVVTRNEGTTGGGGPTKLQFVAATYTLEGGFLGFRDLSPELQFCERPQNALGAWTAFGNNVVNTCELDLATGFAGQPASPLFFEPYLVSGPSGNLYPVPVIIDAAGRDGVAVRRFFTYDNVTADSGGGELKAVRVMTTAKLSIVLRDTEGHIEPPQLHVTYGDFGWPPAAAASVTLTFTAEYSQDQLSYRRSVTIATFVFLGLAFLVALVSQMSWRSRNERRELWGQVLFLYHWAGAFSTLLFWLLFGSSLYWLVFINGQTTVYLVVPTATQDVLFETLIITAMTLKLFEVLVLIHRQTSVDVFLIDWERPKGRLANAAETSTEDTVSIWRTYFVANEWNEIQMERKVKPVFLLLSVLFFQYATDIGSPKDTVSGSEHNLFRFAWTSILFISLGAAQWVFYVFFYSRFIEVGLHNRSWLISGQCAGGARSAGWQCRRLPDTSPMPALPAGPSWPVYRPVLNGQRQRYGVGRQLPRVLHPRALAARLLRH